MKKFYLSILMLLSFILSYADVNDITIKGTVKDKKTSETIIGAHVKILGTSIGAATDINGEFKIANLKSGIYNIEISFISYKKIIIENVEVKDKTVNLQIDLEEEVATLKTFSIVATKKTDTEVSMINNIKNNNLVANGTSSQQIQKTQDKDAADVVKKIPGITIIDDRYIVVRGLSQRYNTVWLNNIVAPSTESDERAFSFDIMPASAIDNLVVYKTSSPEFSGDYTGAFVQIATKTSSEKNAFNVSLGTSYRQGTTFKNFEQQKLDSRHYYGSGNKIFALPSDFPTNINEINNNTSQLEDISRNMNKSWTTNQINAPLDQSVSIGITNNVKLKKNIFTNYSSINWGNSYSHYQIFNNSYLDYNQKYDKSDTASTYIDNQYSNTVKLGYMQNFGYSFGKWRIDWRNLFNNISRSKSTLREGNDYSNGNVVKATELSYTKRYIYTTQFGTTYQFNENSRLNVTLGYSQSTKDSPDTRRLSAIKNNDNQSAYYNQYGLNFSFTANPTLAGRLFSKMDEKSYAINTNFEHKLKIKNFEPSLKYGIYAETKNKEFSIRNLGFVLGKNTNQDFNYMSIDEIFSNNNINANNGIILDENTNASDAYQAENKNIASYFTIKIPIISAINIYTGLRIEKNILTLNSFKADAPTVPVNYNNDTISILPSANISYQINKKHIVRFAYGKSINRPEFREIAPFAYEDFDLKAGIRGNPNLKICNIDNFDLRYEFYPSAQEMITVAGFYKNFNSPIESTLLSSGSGLEYTFVNAASAKSLGLELDIKKSFDNLADNTSILRYLKDFSIVFNASLIQSSIKINNDFATNQQRPMQGQSPYIVNTTLLYQNDNYNLNINVVYNVIGKHIAYVGASGNPDVYEMPFHSLDLNFSQKFGKYFEIKGGIKNILNQTKEYAQTIEFTKSGEGSQNTVTRKEVTKYYKPGSVFNLGLSFNF